MVVSMSNLPAFVVAACPDAHKPRPALCPTRPVTEPFETEQLAAQAWNARAAVQD